MGIIPDNFICMDIQGKSNCLFLLRELCFNYHSPNNKLGYYKEMERPLPTIFLCFIHLYLARNWERAFFLNCKKGR